MSKIKVIIDTDIGSDIDDAYALVFALNSKEIDIKAIITNNSQVKLKTQIINQFTKDTPIFYGIENNKGQISTSLGNKKYETKSFKENLNIFLDDELVYISLGALSNLSFLIKNNFKFKKLIIMGGSLNKNYKGENKKIDEWNLNCDLEATKQIFESNNEIILVPLDVTWNLKLNEKHIFDISNNIKKTSKLLNKHYIDTSNFLYKKYNIKFFPTLHDPLAVYASFNQEELSLKKMNLTIDNSGMLVQSRNKNININVINSINLNFIEFFMNRILK